MKLKFNRSSERGKVGLGLMMLLVGAAAGAVTVLLLTPKTGQQMRRVLRRKFEDATETFGELREQAGDALERGVELAAAARHAAGDRIAPLTKAMGA